MQITDEPRPTPARARRVRVSLVDVELRVLSVADLLRSKLLSARDRSRRRSKRFQDLTDIDALVAVRPGPPDELTGEDRLELRMLDE